MGKDQSNSFGWLLGQAQERKGNFVVSVCLAAFSTVCGIAPYFVIARVINQLIEGNRDTRIYVAECGLILLFWLGKSLFHAFSTAASHVATFHVLAVIRKKCLDKLAKMPLGDVLNQPSGALKSTIVERVDSIETTLAHILPEFTTGLGAPVLVLIYVFVINWKMGLAALVTVPLGFACYMGMMFGYEENYKRTVEATKNLNDTSVEYINGIEVIKVFGKAESSYEKFVAAAKESAASFVDWMRKCNVYFTFAMCIMPATMVSVLPIGGVMMMHKTISAADFITIIVMTVGLIEPIIACMAYSDDIAQMDTVVGQVRAILEAPELTRPDALAPEHTPKNGDIVLKDVHFSYVNREYAENKFSQAGHDADGAKTVHSKNDEDIADGNKEAENKEILHGINMEIKQGEFVALVGPSGSGKSTIARLIASLWDVNSGSIMLGGVNIKDIPIDDYNDRIAYVSQDNYLFDMSICDNIRLGRTNQQATDEEVEQAARQSGCHEFIMGLEHGYDTIVGSAGGHLSGGEKQRISIARAMLKNADIVILDEATAYTDPENEAVIQESVAKLVRGKTLIVIAHRLSTIKEADCIYVVKDGTIAESGTHDALLKKNGLYSSMWQAHMSVKDDLGGDGNV